MYICDVLEPAKPSYKLTVNGKVMGTMSKSGKDKSFTFSSPEEIKEYISQYKMSGDIQVWKLVYMPYDLELNKYDLRSKK